MIECPEFILTLSRDRYYHRISAEAYRQERRRIIDEMERAHNRPSVSNIPEQSSQDIKQAISQENLEEFGN